MALNPFKLAKLTKLLWDRPDSHDILSNDPEQNSAAVILQINSQLQSLTAFQYWRRHLKTKETRDLLWGRGKYSKEYQENEVIPKITNKDYLEGLPGGTVGSQYLSIIQNYDLKDLWDFRFNADNYADDSSQMGSHVVDMRSNSSRHYLLCHDFWHACFMWDTSNLGESCIMAATAHASGHIGPRYVSFWGALSLCHKNKSWGPMKVRNATMKAVKQVDPRFWLLSPLDILDKNIADVREEYNIPTPIEFILWALNNPDEHSLESIHPEYKKVNVSGHGGPTGRASGHGGWTELRNAMKTKHYFGQESHLD